MSKTQTPIVLTPAQQISRHEILDGLRESICNVIFTKVDGTERTMRCTLKQDLLPVQEAVADESQQTIKAITPQRKPRPESNISVWDIEKSSWRSFNITTVIRWEKES